MRVRGCKASDVAMLSTQKEYPDVEDFVGFLEQTLGSAGRAWRVALDLKGLGVVGLSDFGVGCRTLGWRYPHAPLWHDIARNGNGLVTLRALHEPTAKAIDRFRTVVLKRYSDFPTFWAQLVDPLGTGLVGRQEFICEIGLELGISKGAMRLVFNVLDTANTGWVAASELSYVESFESSLAEHSALIKSKLRYKGGKPLPTMMSAPELSVQSAEKVPEGQLSPGALGSFKLPWLQEALAPEKGSPNWRPEWTKASPRMASTYRQLWEPLGSSRTALHRAMANSVMLKKRWLTQSIPDRCYFKAEESLRESSTRMKIALRSTPQSDIFRTTSEFYRAGVERLLHVSSSQEQA